MLVAGVILIASIGALMSLATSHYIYDRSPLSRGTWLDGVDPAHVRKAAIFHAGQDEASVVVAQSLPFTEIQTFDFFDAKRNGTPSLRRARAIAKQHAVSIDSQKIPLENETLDLALVVFAAHEIRQHVERASFFRELGRVLNPGGSIIIVEHMRDGWNLLAYGPGVFHFLSLHTWRQSFAHGGLMVARETSCTPFIRIFELRKQ